MYKYPSAAELTSSTLTEPSGRRNAVTAPPNTTAMIGYSAPLVLAIRHPRTRHMTSKGVASQYGSKSEIDRSSGDVVVVVFAVVGSLAE